jgi:predicted nucleic acid-binding protein
MIVGCVIDTSLALTLNAAGSLDLMFENTRYDWWITPLVRDEVLRAEAQQALNRAITGGRLKMAEINMADSAELQRWAAWSEHVDAGEAEAIALALSRGWLIALEDRQAQRTLDREAGPGKWINTVNLLLDAVADDRLSMSAADQVFRALDCYMGYVKRGVASLGQLAADKT